MVNDKTTPRPPCAGYLSFNRHAPNYHRMKKHHW